MTHDTPLDLEAEQQRQTDMEEKKNTQIDSDRPVLPVKIFQSTTLKFEMEPQDETQFKVDIVIISYHVNFCVCNTWVAWPSKNH